MRIESVLTWSLGLVLATFMMGCDYHTDLPNGYTLARTNANTKAIFAPDGHYHPSHCSNGVAIAARVDGMAVTGKWVVGHVVSSPQSELAAEEAPGFFILNTQTDMVSKGLTETEWKAQLTQQRIGPGIRLSRP